MRLLGKKGLRPEALETARRVGSAPRSPGLRNEYEGTGVCAAPALQDGTTAPDDAEPQGLRGVGWGWGAGMCGAR